ncbi:MAG TPA: hypothetical protein VI957_01885 [Candidatus Paceibacterota bacterium]
MYWLKENLIQIGGLALAFIGLLFQFTEYLTLAITLTDVLSLIGAVFIFLGILIGIIGRKLGQAEKR